MHTPASSQSKLERFLVCGLGSVGQHCVAALKEFGVSVSAIDKTPPKNWEIPNLPRLLDDLIIGDCRQPSVLEQGKIRQCRAILLVTNKERVNIETALEARELNRQTRLVVRSAQENLNQLLAQQLGNFVAFEPTQMPAAAFALAALETEALGFFNVEGQWLRVVERQIQASDRWCNVRLLHELNTHRRLILYHRPDSAPPNQSFHDWEPDARVQAEDNIVYIELTEPSASNSEKWARNTQHNCWNLLARLKSLTWKNLQQKLAIDWEAIAQEQTRRTATICAIAILTLVIVGTIIFKFNYSDKTKLEDALNLTIVLLMGGFDNVFGQLELPFPIPWWLYLFSIILTVIGTVFVGFFYALLTEKVLASRFQLSKRRPPVPQQDHVVIIGLDQVGQRVATLLQEFKQPLVGIALNSDFDTVILPQMPLIVGNLNAALAKANLSTAKSIIVETDDEMVNLEIGLMARAANPNSHLVIRTFEQRLTDNLPHLLPNAHVLHANALAAEAFAGAAFGENILSLFRLNNQTVLVTEYRIEANDMLNGLLLAEVAYGYEVVPIFYQKPPNYPTFMPSDETRLMVGDRLIILATIEGLRRIEQGAVSIVWRRFKVLVEKALFPSSIFDGANAIARISGCSLSTARDLMKNLPTTLQLPLYKHQAQRLVRELQKNQVLAHIITVTNS
jgi:Trk K+ transport system NAD-binding subunit